MKDHVCTVQREKQKKQGVKCTRNDLCYTLTVHDKSESGYIVTERADRVGNNDVELPTEDCIVVFRRWLHAVMDVERVVHEKKLKQEATR